MSSSTSNGKNVQDEFFENIWKTLNAILLFMLLFCISSFLSFREVAKDNGYDFVSTSAWAWTAVGFLGYWAFKHIFFQAFRSTAYAIVHPKFYGNEEERIYRMVHIQKLTFDMTFYAMSSAFTFYLFHEKHWFPSQLGGQGKTADIFRDYPDWPKDTDHFTIETFYMIQLGIFAFKIAESFLIRRKTYRKVYEFLLHHFMAFTLILFSLLTNFLTVGVVIIFLHDISDMTTDIIRCWAETKFRNMVISVLLFLLAAFHWAYNRLWVFPMFVIRQTLLSLPGPEDNYSDIYFAQFYLIILLCLLAIMHGYWWYWLMKGGFDMVAGKGIKNYHDKGKNVKSE